MPPHLGGRLLVAAPELEDPNFHRAVILVLEHSEDGAVGVVLTQESDAYVAEHLPAVAPHVCDPPVFFVGGPVAEGSVVALAGESGESGEPSLFDLDDLIEARLEAPTWLRLFVGYSGWAPGQLDAEVATGSWIVVESSDGDAFTGDPDGLWRAVLRRQRPPLSRLALYPDNVMSN
jgi:putative transcriptional regulator